MWKEVLENGETIHVKLGEVVIYTEQLTPEQMIHCKNWPKKYKDRLKEAGFEV